MGRNSKDNSLARYEDVVKISFRYYDYLNYPRKDLVIGSTNREELPQAIKYVSRVKKTISALSNVSRSIIIQEFFSDNDDVYWWENLYSKSTFYRLRSSAIKEFLEVFKTI